MRCPSPGCIMEDWILMMKKEWKNVLDYVEKLELESKFPPKEPLQFPWMDTGPGYCYGPAFGHWDSVHIALDLLERDPEQAKNQISNLISVQWDNGMFPSMVWMKKETPVDWGKEQTHPPVWVIAAQQVYEKYPDEKWLRQCENALSRQIEWFEKNRKAGEGFFYTDIKNHLWESGVDEGIRFYDVPQGEKACIDATAHLFLLYKYLEKWRRQLHIAVGDVTEKKEKIQQYICSMLYQPERKFFYDSWAMENSSFCHLTFEGFWPIIVGAATECQAEQTITYHLMNEKEFFTVHPVPTVAISDRMYEKRMWRGPAWNSMTMWIAFGCMQYGKYKEAGKILERAMDATAKVYKETGKIWEFYDSLGGSPKQVQRKPQTEFNTPCYDYLGHSPLHYMEYLWEICKKKEKEQVERNIKTAIV